MTGRSGHVRDAMTSAADPQQIVERALAAAAQPARVRRCRRETSEANLRWANNTMTTNGPRTALRGHRDGVRRRSRAASPRASWARPLRPTVAELVAAAEAAARDAGPADDAAALLEPTGTRSDDWDDPRRRHLDRRSSTQLRARRSATVFGEARERSLRLRRATRSRRPTSAPPPASAAAGCSRPARWS